MAEPFPCKYRGRELRREPCPLCKSETSIKVLQCRLFECCQIANMLKGIRACSLCESRKEE